MLRFSRGGGRGLGVKTEDTQLNENNVVISTPPRHAPSRLVPLERRGLKGSFLEGISNCLPGKRGEASKSLVERGGGQCGHSFVEIFVKFKPPKNVFFIYYDNNPKPTLIFIF